MRTTTIALSYLFLLGDSWIGFLAGVAYNQQDHQLLMLNACCFLCIVGISGFLLWLASDMPAHRYIVTTRKGC